MIILDTDHLSVLLDRRDIRHRKLVERTRSVDDDVTISIVSVEELLRGWLAAIHRRPKVQMQLLPYQRLAELIQLLAEWNIIPFDQTAADLFDELRRQRIPVATMDLKIAAITLSRKAVLVTGNVRDFSRVPNLPSEDWLG